MSAQAIAIIGSGCRFPGHATTPSKLWDLLREPSNLKKQVPEDRFNVDRYYHPDNAHHGTSNVRHSYFLEDDFRAFDAGFFGIKSVEALAMDPQQRLLLETVYESLEAAGLPMENLQGSQTGVFVGNMSVDYADILSQDIDATPTYFAPGTARSILSNRISYFFDWHGPSITIDTACSSSLVALHQAVQSLRAKEIPLAIVAGANLLIGPNQYVAESKLKMLSPNGLSQMWDEAADGYARGDGFASVVLKTLQDAIKDGDKIECIIRETGTNQDGRTKGITMPSPVAQMALIRETYKRAGLDLSSLSDRPQYFEAHGTGTPAGDPVESQAISEAFFGDKAGFKRSSQDPKLLVGSIKTVIGHTEGTAGLASLLKTSLALQNGKVPPNLHFNRLSPTVRPYYTNLEIPTALRDWPEVPEGGVRRASVNSFGFGGANAHAILEAYTPAPQPDGLSSSLPEPQFSPFIFSASSTTALAANVAAHADFIESNPQIDLQSISHTLFHRRSTLQKRAVFAASSRDTLLSKLRSFDADGGKSTGPAATKTLLSKPRTLGIFTGQGAQWARMGAELIEKSPAIQKIVDELENSLASLPETDRPAWSLREEMLAPAATSRIQKAELSQPLCTALQILLVEALKQAGVTFDAVVGHSSGEIGAAYTAGVLTASEAIRIAYYRGFHTHRCQGANGQPGAMMAVGTSLEDAQQLCELDDFQGRLCVAASNSSSSVTISGDKDAIEEVALILEDENKFHRALQVDKAYHSHHMIPCSEPYIASLKACGVSPQLSNESGCTWVSSVYGKDISEVSDDVASVYWANNMNNTVLFYEACETALREIGPFDQIVELGPHPALKGPTSSTIEEVLREKIPYFGALTRKQNAVEALAECLGNLWQANGRIAVDLVRFDAFMSGSDDREIVKELPRYRWDHETPYFHDSRIIRAMRTASTKSNELLGTRIIDNSLSEVRWRNRLSAAEVPWLKHHQVQNQSVFPAAGYIATSFEAARDLIRDASISLIEIKNFFVGQALIIPESGSVEILASLTDITRRSDTTITARFAFFAEEGQSDSTSLNEKASASMTITLGQLNPDALPCRPEPDFQMLDVHEDRFYEEVAGLGLGYTGPFKALTKLQRKMDLATGSILQPEATPGFDRLPVHPAPLDAAIQSIILAYCFPGDTRLRTTHLPTTIDTIQFNVPLLESTIASEVSFRASVPSGGIELADINGDVDLYTEDGSTLIQLQGLHTKPLIPPTPDNDLHLFSEFTWAPLIPQGRKLTLHGQEAISEKALFVDLERVAYYYLQNLDREIHVEKRTGLQPHQIRLFNYVDHVMERVERGALVHVRSEWKHDSHDDILAIIAKHPNSIDLEIMHAVGENLPNVIRGELNMLEPMVQDNRLNRFYVDALGMSRYVEELSRIAAQISNRFPHMSVLEVGAGTGGATKILLKHLTGGFDSYLYTDISSGFFPTAQEVFSGYSSKMVFKTLDIEKDIEGQGYDEQTFDLVIANLVVHATKDLEATMKNLRRLVKPGGYLLLLEITDNDQLRFGFIFGGLPGWWLGEEPDRAFSPCVDIPSWDALARKTGFSGIDEATPHVQTCPLSVLLTQAVDERVSLIREPLNATASDTKRPDLTIIAAREGDSFRLSSEVKKMAAPFFRDIQLVTNLDDVDETTLPLMGSILSLVELDAPVFKGITAPRLKAFQAIFKQCKNILWATVGAKSDNPYAAMVLGIGRNVILEMPHLRFQFLDFDVVASITSRLLVESLLRLEFADVWEQGAGNAAELLWSIEPELRYESGYLQVPRVKLCKKNNMRYNSSRRAVAEEVDPRETSLTLTFDHHAGSYALSPVMTQSAADTRPDILRLCVTKSILRAIRLTTADYLFVVAGVAEDGRTLLGLSDAQSSIITVDKTWTMPVANAAVLDKTMLALYEMLLVQSLLHGMESGNSLVVLDSSVSLARALKATASRRGIHVTLLSSSKPGTSAPGSILVHPRETIRSLQSKLPPRATRFANFSADERLAQYIVDSLPAYCDSQGWKTLTRANPFVTEKTLSGLDDEVWSILRAAWAHVKAEQYRFVDASRLLYTDPALVLSEKVVNHSPSFVDWTVHSTLPSRIRPSAETLTFEDDKTYWLVGLTGGLGQSLCRWMVARGARYIVMTSRNPQIDHRWMTSVESQGAAVRVFSCDITRRESVQAAYKAITATMPPFGGIAQGAMILQDAMFSEMTVEKMERVLRPKVEGSMYLEEIFYDTPLDFFVYFSSVAAITGNKGQSVYAAANMFMATLAAQRRSRGVAGAAINIGAVMGNGYITRELNRQQQTFLQEVGNVWLSEQDFLTIFAEGVLASRPNSKESPETITGLRLLSAHDDKISWASDPKFQHLVRLTEGSASAGGKTKGVPLHKQIEDAKSDEEISTILDNAFSAKLRAILQIQEDRAILDVNLDDLGMDSLVAVEVRSWFLKELGADITVLQVLNGGTPNALLQLVKAKVLSSSSSESKAPPPPASASSKAVKPEMAPEIVKPHLTVDKSEDLLDSSDSKSESDTKSESKTTSKTSSDFGVNEESYTMMSASTPQNDTGSDYSGVNKSTFSKDVTRSLPLSFGQSRFWFLKHFLPDQTAFNITTVVRMQGFLDLDRLAAAVTAVGNRHEALRTAFVNDQNQPMQVVLEASPLYLEVKPIAGADEVAPAHEAIQRHVYDLESGQTMRLQVLTLSPTTSFLILGYHHINMDGLSFEVFFNDIQKAFLGASFTPGVMQYPDFTLREHEEFRLGKWKSELDFWKSEFSTLPEPLPLLPFSTKQSRLEITQYGTRRVQRRISEELSTLIKKAARNFKAGVFAFYLAALKATIARYIDADEICIGMADANRRSSEVLESLGLFLNLVPLRVSCDASQPFSDCLSDMQKKSQLAFSNGRVPFDILLNELGVPRSASLPPLFQVFMNYRQGVAEIRDFCGCECEGELLSGGELAYDLSFDIVENPGGETNVMLSFQKTLYDETGAEILLDSYFNLLEAFAKNPASRINKPSLHKQSSIDRALELGAGPVFEHAWPATMVHKIQEQIEAHPGAVALIDGDSTSMTYSEMGILVDRLSAALDDANVTGIVGVFQQPTPASVASILAIMKSGRVFVPLDPRVGLDKLSTIALESQLSCVIVDHSTKADAAAFLANDVAVIHVDEAPLITAGESHVAAQPGALAALIYTSGSTGRPKGIKLSHASLRNNIEITSTYFDMGMAAEVVLQQTAFSFDMSLFQILLALGTASTLVVVPSHVRGDSSAVASLIRATGVTITAATPSEYVSLLRHGQKYLKQTTKWRLACSGGEKVTDLLVGSFKSLGGQGPTLINAYGPAEATFLCAETVIHYHEKTALPLKPYPNYTISILGQDGKPVPVGVSGEIAVGGAGVSLGYLNNAQLTSEKFPPNPHANETFKSEGWTTLHLTGDRGRLTTEGGLILEGRIGGDSQVKVRGIRIELEEVESAIVKASNGVIDQAAVSVRTDLASGSDYLVAHVELKSHADPEYLQQLKGRLALPQYMKPSIILPISSLPLNTSMKLDRLALQSLPIDHVTTSSDALLPPIQAQVKQCWEMVIPHQLLSQAEIAPTTDFFHVGGTSLLLVELHAAFREKMGFAPSVQDLFGSSTLEGMASLLEDNSAKVESQVYDWEAEAALLSDKDYSIDIEKTDLVLGPSKVIVLTGATGFLGRHILERILGNKQIEKVYCIAVRKSGSDLPRIFSDPRVEIFKGDLGLADLGLSAADAKRISDTADCIVHNGADVSFMKTFASLRRTNVEATKQMARLALRRRIPFHYISSASVTQLTPLDEVGEVSVSSYPPSADADGYITAKWVSERHLELLSQAYGLPIVIHRPASISGNDDNNLDLMGNLFKFVEKLEAVPESKEWKGYFDLISVHSVASAVVKAVVAEQRPVSSNIKYQYESGEIVYPLSAVASITQATENFPIQTMPLEEWVDKAEEKGLSPLLGVYLRQAAARNSRWAFPKLIKS